MNESHIRNVLEAAMLAAGKSLTLAELGQLFDEGVRPKTEEVRAALDALTAEYANRGIEVKETAAGFRIQVRREFSGEISRLWPERPARYSRALLETLALIAYRQPITRAEIEAVRGVAVNPNIIKTVIERNWVRVVGHRDVPGRPELLGTTREFLDYFGLRSLDELPPLADLKAMGEYNLQLELPNAGALGVEGPPDEGAAVPVAALAHEGVDPASSTDGAANEGSVEAVPEGVAETTSSDPLYQIAASASAEMAAGEPRVEVVETDSLREVAVDGVSTFDVLEAVREEETTDSEEPEAAETTVAAGETVEVLDDTADDEADEDELSADGHGSRELVAGPHDHDE